MEKSPDVVFVNVIILVIDPVSTPVDKTGEKETSITSILGTCSYHCRCLLCLHQPLNRLRSRIRKSIHWFNEDSDDRSILAYDALAGFERQKTLSNNRLLPSALKIAEVPAGGSPPYCLTHANEVPSLKLITRYFNDEISPQTADRRFANLSEEKRRRLNVSITGRRLGTHL